MEKYKERKWSGEKGKKFGKTDDPYLPAGGRHEMAVCTTCKAIYQKKRWFFDAALYQNIANLPTTNLVTCPGCQKVQDRYYEGVITLSGDFLAAHREEVLTRINTEAETVARKNPLDRIIDIRDEPGKVVVETTTDKLAQRLGKAVYRAYKGDLDIRWSHLDKFVRVYWKR